MAVLRSLYHQLPESLRKLIYRNRVWLKSPQLIDALHAYTYTDEHLKFVHILEAMNYLRVAGAAGEVLQQTYFEFGCHSGRTFSAAVNAARYLGMSHASFYAFDSFEGLPETRPEEDGYFKAGAFCTSRQEFLRIVKKKTGLRLGDEYVVPGFYCDSLTPELQARMPKAGVVHIDVDLYSSTVDVLRFLKPLLVQGTLLVFDDWYAFPGGSLMGERRALTEFLADNPGFEVEPWKAYSTFGQSFFVSKTPA
jgi:O-methyltransferase